MKKISSRAARSLTLILLSVTAFGESPRVHAEYSSDSRIPQTPVGEVFNAWLAATNSDDPQVIRAYNDRYHAKMSVEETLVWRESSGGVELLRIQQSGATSLEALIKERDSDQFFEIKVVTDGESPATLGKLEMNCPSAVPPEFLPARLSQSEALKALEARATTLAGQDRFAGTVLIARHGRVLLERSWGLADRAARTAITDRTQFRLGSMNKMFTAVAILQLVDAGKVSLQSPLITYLPDYPNGALASKVTIRHLLTHTGGTGDIFGEAFDANKLSLKANGDYLKLYGARAVEFEPGSEDRYSNYGFVLLGAVIERVSGESYYDYVQAHIFKKAGMSSSASPPESQNVSTRAIGYMRKSGEWVGAQETLPYRGMAAGGGLSTARDFFNFARALQSGQLIKTDSLAAATTPQNHYKWYGYGFMVSGEGSEHHYGHEGGAPGMNGDLQIYPALGVVVVVLSNLDPPAADRLSSFYTLRMPLSAGSL